MKKAAAYFLIFFGGLCIVAIPNELHTEVVILGYTLAQVHYGGLIMLWLIGAGSVWTGIKWLRKIKRSRN
jgi:hypothetical protein